MRSGGRRCASPRWPTPRPTAKCGRRAARPPSPSRCWRRAPSATCARKAAIFSISQPHASSSRGPAVLEIAISRYFSSASIFSGGSILSRVVSTAHSSTAACARLKPSHGRWLASCTRLHEKRGRCSIFGHLRRPPAPNAKRRRRACTPGTRVAGRVGQSLRPVTQPAKTRTSSVWLATAYGTCCRLSSVVEGRNGAMIQFVAVLDQTERRDVRLTLRVRRRHDRFDDTRHPASPCGRLSASRLRARAASGHRTLRSAATPQSSGPSCA